MRRVLPILILAATTAFAPSGDALRDRLIADAKVASPGSFDRTMTVVQQGGGRTDKMTRIERWDGKAWSLISINGKEPTPAETRDARKALAALPVPGYYRLATLLAAGAERSADAQGRTVLRIAQLPAGSVPSSNGDLSEHLSGEAIVATTGGEPWVQRLKITAREPFKMGWMLKVTKFEQTSEYRRDGSTAPRLTTQTADSSGTMMGITGGQHNEVSFSYR